MHYYPTLSKDRKLKKIIETHGPLELRKHNRVYLHLCASIMSQQLSVKVARVIHQRFLDLYNGKNPKPEQVLQTPFEKLRGIGLSNAKANYVQHVCRFFIEEKLTDRQLHGMENEEVIEMLTRIKGVGRWTAEMILMFTLGREDVFAVDDLGIQNAMTALYKLDNSDKKKLKDDLLRISKKWSPYRTYACMYLWRHKDTV
ncbi:MAG: DNA-3-methyladenine glycosylase 2 family protein [Bacteroidia bacterium]|nr:DNA-3-methyladenine glycosylase 2 family protein [Bacteroidia bacterium]